MEFKDLIRSRRLELNMTMEEVATKIGVSTPTIQRYESGNIKNVRRDKIALLANALNCSPEYLMGWTEREEKIQDLVEKMILKNGIDTTTKEGKAELLEIFEMALKLYKMKKGE